MSPVKSCRILSNPVQYCQTLSYPVKPFQILLNPVKACQIFSNFVEICQIFSNSFSIYQASAAFLDSFYCLVNIWKLYLFLSLFFFYLGLSPGPEKYSLVSSSNSLQVPNKQRPRSKSPNRKLTKADIGRPDVNTFTHVGKFSHGHRNLSYTKMHTVSAP